MWYNILTRFLNWLILWLKTIIINNVKLWLKENVEVEETVEEDKTQECKDQLDICSSWRGQEAALCQYSNIFKLCPKTCKACTVSEVTQETLNTTVIPGTTETPVITKPVIASAAQDHSCEKKDLKLLLILQFIY